MEYLLLKWIHIVSSTILFGAGVGSAFHLFVAMRRGVVAEIHGAARSVVIADTLLTLPAVITQLVTGLLLMREVGYGFSEFWLAWGLALYLFAGACWLPVLWIQVRMRDLARFAVENDTPLPPVFTRLDRWWTGLGALAFPAILLVFYLMVFKPDGFA